jgi:hypothetical protein
VVAPGGCALWHLGRPLGMAFRLYISGIPTNMMGLSNKEKIKLPGV